MDSWHAGATGWTVPGQGRSVGLYREQAITRRTKEGNIKALSHHGSQALNLALGPQPRSQLGPGQLHPSQGTCKSCPASQVGTLVLATPAPPSQLCSIVAPTSRSICMRAQRPPTTQAADAVPTGWWPDISLWELKVSGVSETLVFSLGLARPP